ncbi:MAG: helix-turn-helix domain-containing protein [Pseudonocardiaceae bacterium]|nr:helix-turn-helix domain-containing protein [Pseudonocardiaceae bacterium]
MTVPWLHPSAVPSGPPGDSTVGEVLRWWRYRAGISQQQAAQRLATTQSRLSRIETGGHVICDVGELRRIASVIGVAPECFGVLPDSEATATTGAAERSQREWRRVRRELNSHRATLGDLAAELYPDATRVGSTGVLTRPGWMPGEPVELDRVKLRWLDSVDHPAVMGTDPRVAHVLPYCTQGGRYDRYSRALRDLARPTLLDNRISYRLLDVAWGANGGQLRCHHTSYFDVLDVCEAVAHEFTAAWLRAGRKAPAVSALPWRQYLGDGFDLAARPMLPSINTLTIRRDPVDGHRIYLHRRDAASVAAAGGMLHVSPAGAFQPSCLAVANPGADFSLWRTIQREYSEEFLGRPEHDGNSTEPIDYRGTEPFRSLDDARACGDLRVHVCGVVLEPLTLWVELLTVAVFEAPVFDELFGPMVDVNEEGTAVSTEAGNLLAGVPFCADTLVRLAAEPLSPVARALVGLAWQHRWLLLAG